VVPAAENLDAAPIGTAVSGSFQLGGKLIPLPESQYVLTARAVGETAMLEGDISQARPKVVRVLLAQVRPPRVRGYVFASVSLKPANYRFKWSGEPCKKEDTLYRADLTGSRGENENCLLVDHTFPSFGARSQGIWRDATGWLAEHNVQFPVPVMITANVTRFEGWQLVAATYAFNPRMYGCNAPISRSWADSPWHKKTINEDPQRVRFVESVTAWGKMVQGHFEALVAGRESDVQKTSGIYNCAAAQVALGQTP
jgi:hypothetical protein